MEQNDKRTELIRKIAAMSLISSGIAFITLFIPIFTAFGGLFSTNLFNYFRNIGDMFEKLTTMEIEQFGWDMAFWVLSVIVLASSVVGSIMSIIVLANPKEKKLSNMGTSAKTHFIIALVVFGFCLLYIFSDGGVGAIFFFIFGGTYSWLFPVLHIAPFCFERRYRKEYQNAKKEEAAERNQAIRNGNYQQPGYASFTEKPLYQAQPQSEISNEKEKLELLKEYKTLLDSEIISREEFEEKKEELMKKNKSTVDEKSISEPSPEVAPQDLYNVVLVSVDRKKIMYAVKTIQEKTEKDLVAIKEIVENLPSVCIEAVTYDEAVAAQEALELYDATADIVKYTE